MRRSYKIKGQYYRTIHDISCGMFVGIHHRHYLVNLIRIPPTYLLCDA